MTMTNTQSCHLLKTNVIRAKRCQASPGFWPILVIWFRFWTRIKRGRIRRIFWKTAYKWSINCDLTLIQVERLCQHPTSTIIILLFKDLSTAAVIKTQTRQINASRWEDTVRSMRDFGPQQQVAYTCGKTERRYNAEL